MFEKFFLSPILLTVAIAAKEVTLQLIGEAKLETSQTDQEVSYFVWELCLVRLLICLALEDVQACGEGRS